MKINRNICSCLIFFSFVLLFFVFSNHEVLGEEPFNSQSPEEVKIISNPKTPSPKNGVKIRIVFKEELSIGVEEGDENYMFGNDVVFNTDDKGNFYVTDWDRKRIQKYDPEGKYLLTIGRLGQGPGEFQNISKVRFDSGNKLYVVDISSRRISFFDHKGEFQNMIKSPVGLGRPFYINSQGFFIFRENKIVEYPDGTGAFISTYGLFDNNFDLVVEFYREKWEAGPPSSRDEDSIAKNLAKDVGDSAFRPKINFIVRKDDYVYFGYPEKYEMKVFNPGGDLIKIIKREYDPIRVIQKDIEIHAQNYKEKVLDTLQISEYIKEKAIRLAKYPRYKPAYNSFTFTENGWLLVIVDSLDDEYVLFDIFNQEGRYIAQFKAAIPARGLFFKNGKAYAVATENGYKFVKRYRYEIQEFRNNEWVRKKHFLQIKG